MTGKRSTTTPPPHEYYSVEGLRDFWLLIDAGKIENRKTLFFQQCAHLIVQLIN